MGSIGNPKTRVPYMNIKDCSQGFCSLYCPQWCYMIIFPPDPPPPPPPVDFSDDDDSGPNFSPLVIAIIGILASAFLLVSCYTIISNYCVNLDSNRRREDHDAAEAVLEDNHNPSAHEPWQTSTTGLDEALIESITVLKFKKGDGLIEGTDCSVCLSEFQEDESLRLLPKCSHAFHLQCIDAWLRSHSNCPLCRANIIFISASTLPLPPTVTESPPANETLLDYRQPVRNENVAAAQNVQERAFSDLSNEQGRDRVIEIRGEGYERMRRSVSMDHLFQNQLSVAGPSKQSSAEGSKISNKKRMLDCVINPVAMKRSVSSGRFFLTWQGRARDPSLPL